MAGEQDQRVLEAIQRNGSRLLHFIRSRVSDQGEAEDILQDVFSELIEAYRLMRPIEQVGAWLFQVARNRITDRFRKKKTETLSGAIQVTEEGEALRLEDLLPSPEAGPEAVFARRVLLEELELALSELPQDQRDIFLGHEVDGYSFKELAKKTGLDAGTLISRKHRAVVHLRRRLQAIHDEFTKR